MHSGPFYRKDAAQHLPITTAPAPCPVPKLIFSTSCWCQESLCTAEACWHWSHSQDPFFLLKKLKGSTFRREIVFLYYPLPTSGRWRSEKNAVCEVNINVTIDVSWKRFRLLLLNQRNSSLLIEVMIIFLCFWFGFFFWSNICTSFQSLLLPDLYQMTLPRSSYLVPSCQASPSFTSCMGADLFAL